MLVQKRAEKRGIGEREIQPGEERKGEKKKNQVKLNWQVAYG